MYTFWYKKLDEQKRKIKRNLIRILIQTFRKHFDDNLPKSGHPLDDIMRFHDFPRVLSDEPSGFSSIRGEQKQLETNRPGNLVYTWI